MTRIEDFLLELKIKEQIKNTLSNIPTLMIGDTFKNINVFLEYFGFEGNTVRRKYKIFGIIQKYIEINRTGQKITVLSIKDTLEDIFNLEVYEGNIFQNCIRKMIYIQMQSRKRGNLINQKAIITFKALGIGLGLIGNVFSEKLLKTKETKNLIYEKFPFNDSPLSQRMEETEYNSLVCFIIDVFISKTVSLRNREITKINKICKNLGIIDFNKRLLATEGEIEGIGLRYKTDEEDTYKILVKKLKKTDRIRLCTVDEENQYNKIFQETVEKYGCKNINEIFLSGKNKSFYKKFKTKIGIDMDLFDICEVFEIINLPLLVNTEEIDFIEFKKGMKEDRVVVNGYFKDKLRKSFEDAECRKNVESEVETLKRDFKISLFNFLIDNFLDVNEQENIEIIFYEER